MSVLDEEYLKNIWKVYNDFCNKVDSYEFVKDFIDNILVVYLVRYKVIILVEYESCVKNDEVVRNFVILVLLLVLVLVLVLVII